MSLFEKIFSRFEHWPRKKRSDLDRAPLREFVYLDDVSVYSLLTSRVGPLVTDYTDTRQNVSRNEVTGKVGSDVAGLGLAKAELASKLEASHTSTSQVLKKSTVQSAFRDLSNSEASRFAFRTVGDEAEPPMVKSLEELEKTASSSPSNWVIDPNKLKRGQLLDIEVELEADGIYKLSSMVSALLQMLEENKEVFPASKFPKMMEATAVNRILERLMVGLIPLRCRVADYSVIQTPQGKLIVHKRIASQLQMRPGYDIEPLYLVGLTEERLYWKDVRRVLFSRARFRTMCRLNHQGLNAGWVPGKLVHVLGSIAPELADQVERIGKTVLMGGATAQSASSSAEERATVALAAYGLAVAEECGISDIRHILPTDTSELENLLSGFGGDLKSRRAAFDMVASRVIEGSESSLDRTTLTRLRAEAMLIAGFGLDGKPVEAKETTVAVVDEQQAPEHMLECEFVAIYW